jgi:hypothetical protein
VKKLIALLIVAGMLAVSVGCSGTTSTPKSGGSPAGGGGGGSTGSGK